MPYAKYTREVLADAAASARSIADILRNLGIRPNGGAHAHISRQLIRFGIDTAHFSGSAHNRGGTSSNRKPDDLVLVKLGPDARRTPGFRLRRAMRGIGVPERCNRCGLGTTWNGEPLILHVDHINGDFLNNRRDNVQLLCPNCHSQTATYSGRNRRVLGRTLPLPPGSRPVETSLAASPTPREAVIAVIVRFNDGELTVAQAAEEIGCSHNHVFLIRKRLVDEGALEPRVRSQIRAAQRAAVIAFALANPRMGYRAISAALRQREVGRMVVGNERIRAILTEVGLNTPAAREAAGAFPWDVSVGLDSDPPAEVAEWQTRRP